MGFKFRYASLLSYRQHLKEMAEVELHHAQERRVRARSSLDGCRAELQQARQGLFCGLRSGITAGELMAHSDYLIGLKNSMEALEREVAGSEAEVREKQAQTLTRAKEYKIMEKLKERDFQKWTRQEQLTELRVLNETAIQRHGRRAV